MNGIRVRTGVMAAAVAAGMLALAGCGNGPPAGSSGGGGGGGGGGDLQVVKGQNAATSVDETDQLQFSPSSASVKVGDVVKWTNGGSTAHNVTFDNGTASDTMNGGDVFEVKFTKAGKYQFKCTFHQPGMVGTITVQ